MDLEALNNGWEIVNLEELAGAPSSGSGNMQIWSESDGLHFQNDSNERILTYAGSDTLTDLTISDTSTPTITITDTTTPVTATLSAGDSVANLQTTTAHSLVLGTNSTAAITIDSSQAVTLAGNLTVGAGTVTQTYSSTSTSAFNGFAQNITSTPSGAASGFHVGNNLAFATGGAQSMASAAVLGNAINVYHSNTNTLGELYSFAANAIVSSGAGNVTTANPGYYQVFNQSANTISTAIGLRVHSASNTGGGAITTNYGLKIENQTAGGTNYAIHTGAGQVSLGDDVHIDSILTMLADQTSDTAPTADTSRKKLTLQYLAAPPTNAAYIAASNNPGGSVFYLVIEEG